MNKWSINRKFKFIIDIMLQSDSSRPGFILSRDEIVQN